MGDILKRQHDQAQQEAAQNSQANVSPATGTYMGVPVQQADITPIYQTDLLRHINGLPTMSAQDIANYPNDRDVHQEWVNQQFKEAANPNSNSQLAKVIRQYHFDMSGLGNQGVKDNQVAYNTIQSVATDTFLSRINNPIQLQNMQSSQSNNALMASNNFQEKRAPIHQSELQNWKALYQALKSSNNRTSDGYYVVGNQVIGKNNINEKISQVIYSLQTTGHYPTTQFFPTAPNLSKNNYPDVTQKYNTFLQNIVNTTKTVLHDYGKINGVYFLFKKNFPIAAIGIHR